MKKVFILLMLCLLAGVKSYAALTWADEFNSLSGWSFMIGPNDVNGELQYYLSQNASVSGGILTITAKAQSYGGKAYTSARMNKVSFLYGFFESRIQIPVKQGSWPAFWMLGTNIGSVGWPACGEIDILEQVNTGSDIHASLHWNNGGQKDWTAIRNISSPGSYHLYQCNWNMYGFKFYVDGAQIGGWVGSASTNGMNDNGMGAFRKNQFVILNLAVGGFWPGNNIQGLPWYMRVDYVRQYTAAAKDADGLEPEPVFNADGSFARFSNEQPLNTSNFGVNLYPCPITSAGTLNIQLNSYDVNSPVNINIYNLNGQKMASKTEISGDISLSPLDLHAGMYLVKIDNGANTYTQKLIVK
jgi:beta-glucanase (GH16 family)